MAAAVSEQSAPEVAEQYVGPRRLRQEIWIGFDSTTIAERERKVGHREGKRREEKHSSVAHFGKKDRSYL